jgi:2-phospho-L-lactate transferase
MSNSRVETRVDTPAGELSFEEYFVQRWYQDPVNSVRFAGASDAEPAPGVVDAIVSAEAVIIAPSNPVTSIGPILAVPGIHDALLRAHGKVAAISPIVGNAPVAGPAGILMQAHGLTGRKYAGRIQQIITGAIGFDAWEWGVTLFARDPLDFKRIVTEMRFARKPHRSGGAASLDLGGV